MMQRDRFWENMLAVVSIQIMCTFLIWCRIIDIVIQSFSTVDLVATIVLCVIGAGHTVWALYAFPQFRVLAPLPTPIAFYSTGPHAHMDPLQWNVEPSTTPVSLPTHVQPTPLHGDVPRASPITSPIPPSTFTRKAKPIHGLELLQGTRTNLPIMRNSALLGLILAPSSDSRHNARVGDDNNDDDDDTHGNKKRCFRIRDVTTVEEEACIDAYIHRNFALFFLMLIADSLTHPTSTLLVLVVFTNILRLYALWILLPSYETMCVDTDDATHHIDDYNERIAIPTWWIDDPTIAFDVMWTGMAFILINCALYPQPTSIVMSVEVALACVISTRHTRCFWILLPWCIGIIIVTAWGTSTLVAAASFATTACLHAFIVWLWWK